MVYRLCNSSGSGLDRDSFTVEGKAGDALTFSVTRNNLEGHQGDRADLRLIQMNGKWRRKVAGPLPLTLEAKLPKNGTYRVEVRPAGKKKGNLGSGESGPLRGGYQLYVENDGGIETLTPTANVEP